MRAFLGPPCLQGNTRSSQHSGTISVVCKPSQPLHQLMLLCNCLPESKVSRPTKGWVRHNLRASCFPIGSLIRTRHDTQCSTVLYSTEERTKETEIKPHELPVRMNGLHLLPFCSFSKPSLRYYVSSGPTHKCVKVQYLLHASAMWNVREVDMFWTLILQQSGRTGTQLEGIYGDISATFLLKNSHDSPKSHGPKLYCWGFHRPFRRSDWLI